MHDDDIDLTQRSALHGIAVVLRLALLFWTGLGVGIALVRWLS